MKKYFALASLVIVMAAPLTVFADPTPIQLAFTCPDTTGIGIHTLSNFGGARIAGYGNLMVDTSTGRDPYFTYGIPVGGNIPAKIHNGNYSNAGTDYDPDNAIVSCSYTSPTFDPFTVLYQLTNGTGGNIFSQTPNSITVVQYVGYQS